MVEKQLYIAVSELLDSVLRFHFCNSSNKSPNTMRFNTILLISTSVVVGLVTCFEDFTETACRSDLPKAPKKGYWRHMYYDINLHFEKAPRENLNHTVYYNIALDYLKYLNIVRFMSPVPSIRIRRTLKLMLASSQLEERNCDRCSYLITKGNCDGAARMRACYGPGQPHMILGKVLNRRLMEHATSCEPVLANRFYDKLEQFDMKVYKDVSTIGKQFAMVSLNNKWKNVEDMFASVKDPAMIAVNLVAPDASFGIHELINLMVNLDETSAQGRNGSLSAQINSDSRITRKDATDYFYRLILGPCRKFLDVFKDDILEPAYFYSDIRSINGLTPPLNDDRSRQIYYPALASYGVCNNIAKSESKYIKSIWKALMEKQNFSAAAIDRQMREKFSIF